MSENLLTAKASEEITTNNNQAAAAMVPMLEKYTAMYKVGSLFSKSDMVPDTYKKRPENCMIALNIADGIGADPLMVMQNLYLVHGRPAWSSQFLIACVNKSGKFSPIRYKMTGEKGKDSYGCIAWAQDKSGETLESPEVTIEIAKKEGWFTKNGSKWQAMPDLMLRYRAATLFARTYAPELTMGIHTEEEEEDIVDVSPVVTEARPSKFEKAAAQSDKSDKSEPSDMEKLTAYIAEKGIPVSAEEIKNFVESNGEIFSYDMIVPNINAIAETILAKGGK